MRNTNPKVPSELEQLKLVFQNFRNSSAQDRPRYPDALKRRALEALAGGVSPSDVAVACGVNRQSLSNWRSELRPAPRKLTLVDEQVPVPVSPSVALSANGGKSLKLTFPNGLLVELPLHDGAGEILAQLGGLKTC